MSRTSSIVVPEADWQKDLELRRRVFREARRRAKRHYALVSVKTRRGVYTDVVARFDGRFWLYDEHGDELGRPLAYPPGYWKE